MKNIFALLEILRPLNVLITFTVVVISGIICLSDFNITNSSIFAGLSAAIVAAAGNLINDYYDLEIDKINKPQRPIPSGRINKNSAIVIYAILILLSILISFLVTISAIIIVLLTNILLFFYSRNWKKIPLFGNIIVALCTALAFIYGGIAVDKWEYAIIPAIFAFLINLIRELIKDIEDLKGDLESGVFTFPGKYGIEKSQKLILFFTLLLIGSTFYPFIIKFYRIEYFLIVLFLVDILLIKFLFIVYSKNFLTKISDLSLLLKLTMIFGLVAVFVGGS